MVTLEQVEKLREHANISYEEARAALEETNGDILEAIVNLEKQNRIEAPEGGYYNSKNRSQETHESSREENQSRESNNTHGESFGELLGRFLRWCSDIVNRGNTNSFVIMKGEEKVNSIPVTLLVLLLIFMFWITIPLLIIGLFIGYRYRFVGPDLGKENINRAIDSVADAAENFKKDVKGEMYDGKDSDN